MARRTRTIVAAAIVTGIFLAAQAVPSALQVANASTGRAAQTQPPLFDPNLEWPLAHLHANTLWRRTEGRGVTIAVVDTGIDTGQQDLKNAVVGGQNFVGNPKAGTADKTQATPDLAHGTAVAGLIAGRGSPTDRDQMAGLAPEAVLLDVRVATRPDDVTPTQLADGINWAVQHGAQIINVSLATSTSDPQLDNAVEQALNSHCLVVASDGNAAVASGRDTHKPQYPADLHGVLAVGAADTNSVPMTSLAMFDPDTIYAPGTDLYSAAPSEGHGTGADYVRGLQGSDFATAYVSAAAALLLSVDPRLDPLGARYWLLQTAKMNGATQAGNLDPLAALTELFSVSQQKIVSVPGPGPAGPSVIDLLAWLLLAIVVVLVVGVTVRRYRGRVEDISTPWDEPW